MESKKINQLATNVAPQSTDLTIIGDPITGVSKKITWLQVSTLIGTAANLQQVTDNGATTTNPIAIGGLTITGLATGVLKSNSGVIASVPFGAANGVATLGGDGKVPSSQLPSYVDDVVEVANYAALPAIGETGKIYITLDNNKVYRWTGSIYVEIAANNAVWGAITGTLSNQTDLQNALNTKLSSVGLSMPSAFTVTNSPLTANGTIAVTGAGTTAQYVRGDGSLATFPTVANEAERLITEVYNDSGATLTKGTVVYINGGQGNLPTVAKALATGDATSAQTYGVVQTDITNMNNGFVVVIGSLTDLDTQAYANGTQLYLSSTVAGAWTSVKQYAPAHLVYVAIVTRSHPTQGVVEVRIQNGFEMDELHNVAAQSPSNGSLLQYVSSTSLWTAVAGTTTNIAEGTNLYFTDTRARNAISLTTTGTSGVATYSGGVLNIPNYGSALSGYVPYTGATTNVDLGIYNMSAAYYKSTNGYVMGQGSTVGLSGAFTVIGATPTSLNIVISNTKTFLLTFPSTSRTYTYPDATGTLALTSDLSAYLPLTGGTLSGALNINLNSGTGLNVSTENVVFRSSPTYGSPRQLVFSMGSGPTTTLEAKGYGANYITDFNIRTYNSSGTGFDVFFGSSDGNVGINNTSPTSPLDVIANNSTAIHLRLRGRAADSVGQMEFWNNAQSTRYGYIATDSSSMGIVTTQSIPLVLGTNSAERLRITSEGDMGLGTTSPFNPGGSGQTSFEMSGSSYSTIFISANSATVRGQFSADNPNSWVEMGARTNHPLLLITNNTERMRITSGGNVGIGTTSPAAKLSIANPSCVVDITSTTSTSFNALELKNGSGSFYVGQDNSAGSFYGGASYAGSLYLSGAYPLIMFTSGTERMRITSGGEIKALGSDNTIIANWRSTNGMIQFYPYYSTYNGPIIQALNGSGASYVPLRIECSTMTVAGNQTVTGTKSFAIEHPLDNTKTLLHYSTESPKADLIYRGKVNLVNGKAQINIDLSSKMTEGTFIILCRDVQCFTTNETGWDMVKGKVIGNILTIESNNENSSDEISWMVIGERYDESIINSNMLDEDGDLIVEKLK
jgi:hypothetical protein